MKIIIELDDEVAQSEEFKEQHGDALGAVLSALEHFEIPTVVRVIQSVADEAERSRRLQIVELAHKEHHCEGVCEIDDGALISKGRDENGAYVQGWLWVDFKGTSLDAEADHD